MFTCKHNNKFRLGRLIQENQVSILHDDSPYQCSRKAYTFLAKITFYGIPSA